MDWKVKTVSPRKTPKVINLLGDVRVPHRRRRNYDVQSLYDNRIIKICTQYPEGEGFEQRKSGQENEVEWVCVSLPVKQPEIDENTEHGEIVRPRAVSDQHEAA